MSEVDRTREARESRLASRLSAANAEARAVLAAAIVDGVLDESEWLLISAAFQQPLQAELEVSFFQLAQAFSADFGIPVDLDLIQAEAINWARQYSFELVRAIDTRTRDILQASVSDFFAGRMTLEDLERRIATAFSPSRAATIAVTEVTRAASAAELSISDQLRRSGIEPTLVWVTSQDALVCPICGPRDNRPRGDGWNDLPPAHPRCRCTVRIEFDARGGR